MKKVGVVVLLLTLVVGCVYKKEKSEISPIQEIYNVEQRFNDYAAEHGVKEAFLEFSAYNAVLNRRGMIIKGKEAIAGYFDSQPYKQVKLSWSPDFADVSESGDMAYTYGSFTFSAYDSLNQLVESEGIFHTVWKKQPDGSWKFVYD